jgi:hypothetical protein
MTATLIERRPSRRTRLDQIESLLDELEAQRRRLYHLKFKGVRRAGMRDLKQDYHGVQERLSTILEAA